MGVWVIVAIVALLVFALIGRRPNRQPALAGLRTHFPRIARQRLVGSFHDLDSILDQASLRMLFDWIMAQAYCRTASDGFDDLMRWQAEHGEVAMNLMLEAVIRDSVNILPRRALEVIDADGGREYAAILIGHSLTEAAARIAPAGEGETA